MFISNHFASADTSITSVACRASKKIALGDAHCAGLYLGLLFYSEQSESYKLV